MATWQFHSFLLPRASFEARFGNRNTGLPREYVYEKSDNWADEKVANDVIADISQILPEDPDNWRGENGKIWGNSATNDIHVDFSGGRLRTVSFRADLRTLPVKFPRSFVAQITNRDKAPPERAIDFISAILHVATRHDLLLFTQKDCVVLPEVSEVAEALRTSLAFRYVSDPEDFLNRLKRTIL